MIHVAIYRRTQSTRGDTSEGRIQTINKNCEEYHDQYDEIENQESRTWYSTSTTTRRKNERLNLMAVGTGDDGYLIPLVRDVKHELHIETSKFDRPDRMKTQHLFLESKQIKS